MRYHYWQFLVNQEGQPINNANISILLANSDTNARIYTGENTVEYLNSAPQLKTNEVGYFEFWIGDEEEDYGYTKGQKFKIKWDREGIVYGEIDYIDIFPKLEPVDETDPDSEYRNKTVSNNLAFGWENHKDHNVITDSFPIHGISFVNLNSTNSTYNKLVSDLIAKQWEDHKNFTFTQEITAEDSSNAHNLQPINEFSDDENYNKLLNNFKFKRITTRIKPFFVDNWLDNGDGNYYITLNHNLEDEFPSVFCWDETTKKQIMPTDVESINENNLKVIISDNTLHLNIKIIGNY